jgi:hypothetical protein
MKGSAPGAESPANARQRNWFETISDPNHRVGWQLLKSSNYQLSVDHQLAG